MATGPETGTVAAGAVPKEAAWRSWPSMDWYEGPVGVAIVVCMGSSCNVVPGSGVAGAGNPRDRALFA
ncbi:hypothetical protein D3C72_2410770 [compost metagenome]